MAALDELQRRHIAPSWLLEIDGIPERYYGGFAPGSTAIPAPYAATFGVQSVDIGEATLSQTDSIVEDGSAVVRMVITRDNGVANNMLRLVASREVTLLTTVAASTGATAVTVRESTAGWPAAGQLWVGQECMNYTSRSIIAPFWFDVPAVGGRGYYGSQIQEHRVEGPEGWNPKVTDQCVAWRGRRARVKLAAGRRDGQAPTADYITEVSGFIDLTPRKLDDLTVELTVVPDTARLERELGGDELVTGLQHGWHPWALDRGRIFGGGVVVRWGEGDLYESHMSAPVVVGVGAVLPVYDAEAILDVHDFALGPTVLTYGNRTQQTVTGAVVGAPPLPPGGTLTAVPSLTRFTNTKISSRVISDRMGVAMDPVVSEPALTRWPGPALDAIHATYAPGRLQPAPGTRVDFRIHPRGEGPSVVEFRTNTLQHNNPPEVVINWDPRGLWYGIDTRDPGEPAPRNLFGWLGEDSPHLGRWPERRERLTATGDAGTAALNMEIRGIADAYHQNTERYIHVRENVFRTPTPTSPVYLLVELTEGEQELRTHIKIIGITAASAIDPAAPGYILTVRERSRGRHRSFGDWPGESAARIRELIGWTDVSPTQIILELLLSGQGTGINDPTYDVLPYGANMDQSQVDVAGIESFPVPAVALRQTLSVGDDAISIESIIKPMLRLMGGILVHRVDQVTGDRKLTIVPTTAPVAGDSRRTIADGDWSVTGRPTTSTDDTLTNIITYRLNYDREDEPKLTVTLADRDSIGRYEEVGDFEEELRGVRLPLRNTEAQRAALLQPALATFSELARPRRSITGTIPASDALLLDCGSVAIVSASDVYDMDGSLGVASVPGRVMSKRQKWDSNEAELSIRLYSYLAAGWAPSLEVDVVVGPNEVQVKPNAYTATAHPVTGVTPQTDLQYWSVGDVARAIPAGNYGASTAGLVAVTVTATNITFGAPHGLVAGDTIRPDDYDPATAAMNASYAFLADDQGTLGAAADPAKSYS